MPAIAGPVHRQPGEQPRQHPVDAVQLRAARAPRQHQRRPCPDAAEADQVAGIDRHAEMQDLAAGPHDARRPDVAPVHHRAGAGHQQDVRALADSRPSASAIGASSCGHSTGGSRVPPSPSTRAAVASTVPARMLGFSPGSVVITSPTRSGRNGCSRSSGARRGHALGLASTAPGTANGITLMVATISRAATLA